MLAPQVVAVKELWGERFGPGLETWFEEELARSHGRCHFCGQESELKIDWEPLNLACSDCWNSRRAIPYHLVKAYGCSLKAGQRKWCGGETHEHLEERLLVPQRFEEGFSICRECWEHQQRKRKVNWKEYLGSWTDESDWRNRGLPKATART